MNEVSKEARRLHKKLIHFRKTEPERLQTMVSIWDEVFAGNLTEARRMAASIDDSEGFERALIDFGVVK